MQSYAILSLSGVAAAIWMLVGVTVVAGMLPSYSHIHHTLSELGAKGKPTEKIHPLINNYPIGLLFFVFGVYLLASPNVSQAMHFVGALISVHGVCHFITGIFPCDADSNVARFSPSRDHKIHTLAGLVMQLTLLAASIILFFQGHKTTNGCAGFLWAVL